VWQSADPILGKYLPNRIDQAQLKDDFEPMRDLPGMGGVFKSVNLAVYGYAALNPVKYVDPDGNFFVTMAEVRGDLPQGYAERIAGGQLAGLTTAVAGTTVVGTVVAAPAATTAVAVRAAPLTQRVTTLATTTYTKASALVLSASVAINSRIDQATTAIGNVFTRVGAAANDMLGRVLSSPVATNPAAQQKAIDFTSSLMTPGPPSTATIPAGIGSTTGYLTSPEENLR
jgi:hypothetical protein